MKIPHRNNKSYLFSDKDIFSHEYTQIHDKNIRFFYFNFITKYLKILLLMKRNVAYPILIVNKEEKENTTFVTYERKKLSLIFL